MGDILFLAHRIPFPPDRGDKIRSWNMLRHLGTLGRVHLACFADDQADAAHLAGLREAMGGALGEAHVEVRTVGRPAAAMRALRDGKPISLTMFDSPGMRGFVSAMLRRPEIGTVFVFSSQMAQFVPAGCRQRFVMDFGDVDSAKFADYGGKGGLLGPVYRREAGKLLAFERETAERADVSLFVSEAEAGLFRRLAGVPNADIRAVQNGVDLAYYDPAADFPRLEGQGPLIVFTGQMDYAPNIDAVTDFAEEVLPLVGSHARFAIVGRNPPKAVTRLDCENVLVTGGVADIRSWLAAANVVVAPLRIARGIQNKVLEAMAMAKPVVASPAAFEGIGAIAGRDLIVAGTADEQARAVTELLADQPRRDAIGLAARRRVEEAYRWDTRLAPVAEIVGLPKRRAAA